MYAWEQIQQTVDYIDKHLGEELAIDNLAEMASLSPFYYQRLFKRLVKKPVGEYIKPVSYTHLTLPTICSV